MVLLFIHDAITNSGSVVQAARFDSVEFSQKQGRYL